MIASDRRIVTKWGKLADKIIALDEVMQNLSDQQLTAKTSDFRTRLAQGETLNDILVEAFATAREAARRILKLHAYRVQLIGGIVLHEGDVAEMKTGEGKTLTALMPTYLNALSGKGVHIVTVNEYLSKRDSEINGQVLNFLDVSVGLNARDISTDQKREAYLQDVTYTTNSELGFDYLRDNMVKSFEKKAQRGLNFAIIDEADSILIDESRTPLIISGGTKNRTPQYMGADSFVKQLNKDEDLEIDLETKQAFLTVKGVEKAEKTFAVKKLFSVNNTELYHLILNALRANFVFKNGIEYVVKDREIILIDQFTGRLMPGRAYSDGVHQALQAKENVEVEEETITLATITYQNFFRLYNKLSGMTGTAKTEEEEFVKIYNTRVICIPTNKPIIRKDEADYSFANRNSKMKALISEVQKLHEKGQPILIGTTSVESSEVVSHYLEKANLKYEMLNAKNHEREAEIIARAGERGSITLSTNMAGRGTDIKLGEGIAELGGLAVLGIDRNEARRIDNQLRGRSGRQGDPGFSRFYVAIDDDLMLRFGQANKVKTWEKILKDGYMQSRLFTWKITSAQKKVEGMNFDQRKNILDYDNVIAQHRETMYSQRDQILTLENLKPIVNKMAQTVGYDLTRIFGQEGSGDFIIDNEGLLASIENKIINANVLKPEVLDKLTRQQISELLQKEIFDYYCKNVVDVPNEVITQIERSTILSAFDHFWIQHIDHVSKLRSSIHLRSYAQINPLHAYVEEAAKLYENMKIAIAHQVTINLSSVVIKKVDNHDTEQIQTKQAG